MRRLSLRTAITFLSLTSHHQRRHLQEHKDPSRLGVGVGGETMTGQLKFAYESPFEDIAEEEREQWDTEDGGMAPQFSSDPHGSSWQQAHAGDSTKAYWGRRSHPPPSKEIMGYYADLGLTWPCDCATVKAKYQQLVMMCHPDVAVAAHKRVSDETMKVNCERFHMVHEAYHCIMKMKAFGPDGCGSDAPWEPVNHTVNVNRGIRKAMRWNSIDAFYAAWSEAQRHDDCMNRTTLHLALHAVEMFHPLGDGHVKACFAVIEEFEANTSLSAGVEAFDRVLVCYAERCEDTVMAMTCLEQITSRMDEKEIARTDWTNHLISRTMKWMGKDSSGHVGSDWYASPSATEPMWE
eukprot:PhM_4_TR8268/c0_g1_i1/m.102712